MESVFEAQQARGTDNWYHWWCRAQHAVLTGDLDAAIVHLEHAVDDGATSVVPFEALWELTAEDPRFEAIFVRMVARGNAERAELGWEPFQPPPGL